MRGSECIDKEIENYLVDGIVPAKNIVCPAIVKSEWKNYLNYRFFQ